MTKAGYIAVESTDFLLTLKAKADLPLPRSSLSSWSWPPMLSPCRAMPLQAFSAPPRGHKASPSQSLRWPLLLTHASDWTPLWRRITILADPHLGNQQNKQYSKLFNPRMKRADRENRSLCWPATRSEGQQLYHKIHNPCGVIQA